MRRRNRRLPSGPPRHAQRAAELADWDRLENFVSTVAARNVQWVHDGRYLRFELEGPRAVWRKYHFECRVAYNSMQVRLIAIENVGG